MYGFLKVDSGSHFHLGVIYIFKLIILERIITKSMYMTYSRNEESANSYFLTLLALDNNVFGG